MVSEATDVLDKLVEIARLQFPDMMNASLSHHQRHDAAIRGTLWAHELFTQQLRRLDGGWTAYAPFVAPLRAFVGELAFNSAILNAFSRARGGGGRRRFSGRPRKLTRAELFACDCKFDRLTPWELQVVIQALEQLLLDYLCARLVQGR
jgi:hypothetical protein